MGSKAAWIMILVVIFCEQGRATLDIKPSDTVVLLNGSTFFNCSTFNLSSISEEIGSKEIAWYHYSVSSDQRKDVYDDGEIRTNYKSRFRVQKDLSKGVFNLIVQAATLEDAGRYECQDGKGFGETASAQLIVLETEPVCQSDIQPDGVIGSNDCRISPDQVQMSCSIAYRGNIPVHLEWRNGLENDNSPLTVESSNTTNSSTCNLTVTGDRTRNNSAYICQTKNAGMNAYNCSSDVIKILYAMSDNTSISKTDVDEYKCSANSSQQCSYTWYSDETIVSTSESLRPTRNGQYLCQAKCIIRGQTCLVTARNLNVSVETTTGGTSKTPVIVGIVVSLFVIAAAIIAVIAVWRTCIYKNESQKKTDEAVELTTDGSLQQTTVTDCTDENVDLPRQNTMTKAGTSGTDVVDSQVPFKYDIQKAFDEAPFIGKGLNGEIKGPWQYKGIVLKCAFERIMYSKDQQTPANEGEMAKEEKIFSKGRQWKELDHDNLIKFYDVVLKPTAIFIVKEYAAGGSVRKALKKRTEDLSITVVKDWATQIANGMNYLHESDIVHNGLKCAQILIVEPIDPSTTAELTLKVASYSLTYEINTSTPVTFEGMFAWMAPEAILESKHSNGSDIWSYGVTVWEILTRKIPYNDYKPGKIINGISSGTFSLKIPDSCPRVLRDIIEECFDREPKRRPSFSEILTRLRLME